MIFDVYIANVRCDIEEGDLQAAFEQHGVTALNVTLYGALLPCN